MSETQSTRGYIKKVSDYIFSWKKSLLELIKSAPSDEILKELCNIVSNQRILLDWFKQEEKSFIDLKEIDEITNKYIKGEAQNEAFNYPEFNHAPEQIANMEFIELVNTLRLGIHYFENILKRHESLLEAREFYIYKKDELKKEKQAAKEDPAAKQLLAEKEQYLKNTKANFLLERDSIVKACKVDMTLVLNTLHNTLERLNNTFTKG